MELEIYNQSGEPKTGVSPSDSSTCREALMRKSELSLSFTLPEYIPLEVNDYIIFMGMRYTLVKAYRPRMRNLQTYSYNVSFYGPEADMERVKYLNLTDGQYEPSFSLFGTPADHLARAVENLNRIGGRLWKTGKVTEGAARNIEYNNEWVLGALNRQAEAFGTEWWVSDGDTLNMTRCERDGSVELGYRQGLTGMDRTENDTDAPFFTRLIPLGSTRNIDASRYGFSRLQLPDRSRYVERNTRYGLYEHTEEAAFAGIYPRYTGTVTAVRSEEKENENGKYTVYYFKDSGMTFNPAEYEIAGLVKRISFQSGDLNGAGNDDGGNGYFFEANWDAKSEEWEIINVYPDERTQLPGGNLIPRVGDMYIPWNFRMPDEYYPAAEKEFELAVNELMDKYSVDNGVYKADTDHVYIDRNRISLRLGSRVRLLNTQFFPEGFLDTRITGITHKVNNPSEITLECTNTVGKSYRQSLDESIRNVNGLLDEGLPAEIRKALYLARQTQDFINRLLVGAVNLLRNSGFTGNYDTEEVDVSYGLNPGGELYSDKLKYWSGTASVADEPAAVSGKSVSVGKLLQAVPVSEGEKYTVSFKAKGKNVEVRCGSSRFTRNLSDTYEPCRFTFSFSGEALFSIGGEASVYDLQLEHGTVPTAWKASILDNDEAVSRFQSLAYITDAIRNADTEIINGLILTNLIMLGNYRDGRMRQVTAGISGIYNDDDDVAYWAGGTLEQAIRTVMKLKYNPRYSPSDGEWANLANFVVSHGGDVFMRGYIYALGGYFRGMIDLGGGVTRLNEDGTGWIGKINNDDPLLQFLDGELRINGILKAKAGSSLGNLKVTEKGSLMGYSMTIFGVISGFDMTTVIPDKSYIRNFIIDNIGRSNVFDLIFNGATTGEYEVLLPNSSQIGVNEPEFTGGGFFLTLIVSPEVNIMTLKINNNATFKIRPASDTFLYDSNGNKLNEISLAKGDVLELCASMKWVFDPSSVFMKSQTVYLIKSLRQ